MKFRLATIDDAAALAAMNQQLIQDEGHRNAMALPDLTARMRMWLDAEYTAVIFQDPDGIAGYALFRREPDYVYLRQFYVCAEYRRRGIGRTAVRWLQEHPWKAVPRIRLDVLVGNSAGLEFWRAVGFADYCITMEMDSREAAN